MRRKWIILILITLLFCYLSSEPILTPDHRSFDFGEIYEKDGKVSHKFEFENTGDEALVIIDVHAS